MSTPRASEAEKKTLERMEAVRQVSFDIKWPDRIDETEFETVLHKAERVVMSLPYRRIQKSGRKKT